MNPMLSRRGFASTLIKRALNRQVVVLRRSTDSDHGTDYTPAHVLPCTYETVTGLSRGVQRKEGDQQGAVGYVLFMFEKGADVRASDRLLIEATGVVAGPPITYDANTGETLEVTGLDDVAADPTYTGVMAVRKASRKR